jgi:hypothetical protein
MEADRPEVIIRIQLSNVITAAIKDKSQSIFPPETHLMPLLLVEELKERKS